MPKDNKRLVHRLLNCKYHNVFTQKYRRKEIYGKSIKDNRFNLRKLSGMKGEEIMEAHSYFNKKSTKISFSNLLDY